MCARKIRVDEADEAFLHQLPARPRSAQHQVAQVHLRLIVRLVVEQVEQQRQLAFVLPNSRGRRRAVSTHHQRVRDVHSSSRTAGRTAGSTGIASAPLTLYYSPYRHLGTAGAVRCGAVRSEAVEQFRRSSRRALARRPKHH